MKPKEIRNSKFHYLYSVSNIIRTIKSDRIRSMAFIVRGGEEK